MINDHYFIHIYGTKWPLFADVPLSNHPFIHSGLSVDKGGGGGHSGTEGGAYARYQNLKFPLSTDFWPKKTHPYFNKNADFFQQKTPLLLSIH